MRNNLLRQTGFTLVEIMVGLVIGMLATAIILQVMTNFEAQKRVTTGTADAQTNGAIALFNIERELRQAGFPLQPRKNSGLECTTLNYNTPLITSINPISIVDGVSDAITVRYGSSPSGGSTTLVNTVAGNDVTVDNNLACQTGDVVMVVNGITCSFANASAVPVVGATASAVQRTLTMSNTTGVFTDATLACLGNWQEVTYGVVGNTLVRNGTPIMDGIVNLQAQYGISLTANSNQIIQWVESTGAWAAPSTSDRNRIKAVRIAVVARNAKKELKNAANACNTTPTCSSTTGANPTGLCAWDATSANPQIPSPAPSIDLSVDPDWACYRYRVFELIVPLRNVIWSKGTLG